MIKVGSDFSGVGAFNQALNRLGIDYSEVYACDMDKHARQTFIHNYGQPEYYPKDVYEREIPKESLDIYMTSPPCQTFSLAGNRKGKEDERGILFFNSLEFIKINKPRYFIFENVKGLLSDDNGKTFSEWVNMLGGKSVNGNPVLFPYEDSVPYHLYWKVLNAKNYGVPQNRERVFLIGVREDEDNTFRFPKEVHLTKRLKDILESEVDEKYCLSEKTINGFMQHKERHEEKGTGFKWQPKTENDTANTLRANAALCPTDNTIDVIAHCTQQRSKDRPALKKNKNAGGSGPLNKKDGTSYCIDSINAQAVEITNQNTIRRLTPKECFRLMDFPDSFDFSVVSNSQAYKQAGNSIVVKCLELIIKNLKL